MKVGSVFSGIGGIDLGLERVGMQIRWMCEIEPYAQAVIKKNFPGVTLHSDICAIGAHNLEPVDLLCGGSPCTNISNAGDKAGLEGEQSKLWFEYHRVICELRPHFVIVENVSALLVRGSALFSGSWPRSGMMSGGIAFRCPPSALPKTETGSLLWPTPTVSGNYNRKGSSKKAGDGLATAVKRSNFSRESPSLNGEIDLETPGRLNPEWVELLMGFPAGWTELSDPSSPGSEASPESAKGPPSEPQD